MKLFSHTIKDIFKNSLRAVEKGLRPRIDILHTQSTIFDKDC